MIRLCIFDLDGTLMSTQESIARPVNRTLARFGLPPQPVEAFNRFAGDGMRNTLKRALAASGVTDPALLEEGLPMCVRWMNEDPYYRVRPYGGMPEALAELKRRGILLAVCSNKPHPAAVRVVEKIFGEGLFDCVQGQTDEIPVKPDPKGVLSVLERLGVRREECLYFGDTWTDMQTAHNAGLTAVGVTWGFRPRSELEENKADIIIGSPEEIPGLAGQGI